MFVRRPVCEVGKAANKKGIPCPCEALSERLQPHPAPHHWALVSTGLPYQKDSPASLYCVDDGCKRNTISQVPGKNTPTYPRAPRHRTTEMHFHTTTGGCAPHPLVWLCWPVLLEKLIRSRRLCVAMPACHAEINHRYSQICLQAAGLQRQLRMQPSVQLAQRCHSCTSERKWRPWFAKLGYAYRWKSVNIL